MKITKRAEEGMILTDGENYGKTIDLGEGVSVDKYTEITEAEYEEKIKEAKADE